MIPPQTIDVRDRHNGFTALTRSGTLWRPADILDKPGRGFTGTLDYYNEDSFFQVNDDVTRAVYRVPGYSYRVVVWFDNATGERIA